MKKKQYVWVNLNLKSPVVFSSLADLQSVLGFGAPQFMKALLQAYS